MHDNRLHSFTRHAGTEENNRDSRAGANEKVYMYVSVCIRWVTVKACRTCAMISGTLKEVQLCEDRDWYVQMRYGRQVDLKKIQSKWREIFNGDTKSLSSGGEEAGEIKGWMIYGWMLEGKTLRIGWLMVLDDKDGAVTPTGDSGWGCWGVLPVCEGGGDPGQRGWWQGGPLSSSPPPVPGSAVQTAPPALWPTPAEPLRSHTAPYTLHGPKGKEDGEGGGVTPYTSIQPRTHYSTGRGCPTKTDTPLHTKYSKIRWMQSFLGW